MQITAAGEEDPYARWRFWRGVNGQHYARRPRSSPALVLRARGLAGLKSKIRAEERRRRLRPTVKGT